MGNRILFAVAMELGEEGMQKEPAYLKMIRSVFHDNNYKLRRDGIVFMKEYLNSPHVNEIVKSINFSDTYLLELLDFVQDEDMHIQIDAIEALCYVLEFIEKDII